MRNIIYHLDFSITYSFENSVISGSCLVWVSLFHRVNIDKNTGKAATGGVL